MQKIALALAMLLSPATAFMPTQRSMRWAQPHSAARGTALSMKLGDSDDPILLVGVAADSGCGKSTFMRRLTSIFGGATKLLGGGHDNGGWETNTLISDTTTVLCLDDYHLNDRNGRKVTKRTALDPLENNFDLMYEQLKQLKSGATIQKPIYNHVNGTLDAPEEIKPTPIVIIEGLHPMYDERVRELLDFTMYLDISDEVKFAWKIKRDMEERGHSLDSIKASIEARKPDFDNYIAPQRGDADLTIQVLPSNLIPDDDGTNGILRVKMVQKEGKKCFQPAYLFDEGSTIEWTPCGKKLSCSFPGIKFGYGPDEWFGHDVSVLEMDGKFDELAELIYVESHLSGVGSKFYGELTQEMLKYADGPGSDNGTGLFQTCAALKLREFYEEFTGKKVTAGDKVAA